MVMLVCCFAVNASAESIENTAKTIESGKTYSTKLYKNGDTSDYKITLNKSGDLKLKINTQMYELKVYLYDTNGNHLGALNLKADSGSTTTSLYGDSIRCVWNNTVEKYSGSFKYSLDKGTYYLRFVRGYATGSEKVSFKATFPSSGSSSSTETKADCITILIKKSDTLQLAFDENTKWTNSDKTVATISSDGKITAKKVGTATITAKSGNGTDKIKIKVTN